MRPACVVVSFLFACGGGGSPDAPDAAPDAGRSAACIAQDDELQAVLDDTRTSPNAVLAVRDPECGTSVFVSGDPANAGVDSLWRIGSVTKTFVTAAIMSLVEDGALGLDDPLADFVPDVAQSTGVTVRMLLNHRSGIFNYTEDPAFFVDRQRVWTPREIVDLATAHDPYFAPGTDFHYSNTNYVLLGMILEDVEGAPAGDVVHARAIDPAGLAHTFLDGHDRIDGTMATGFDAGGDDVTFLNHPSGPWTAGSMVASGADLVDWMYTYLGTDAILDADSRAELLADPVQGYGLGIQFVAPQTGASGLGQGHGGAIDGYYTFVAYFPAPDTALAVVVNQDGADPVVVFSAAADVVLP